MSRYDPKISKNFSPLWVIIMVLIAIIFATWMLQKNKLAKQTESRTLDIPIRKQVLAVEKEMPIVPVPTPKTKPDYPYPEKKIINTIDVQLIVKPEPLKLEESDDSFRQAVKDVSENLSDWFNVKGVIRKYIIIVNDLSQNQIIYKHRKFLKMPQNMLVKEDSQGLYMDPQSYRRYDRLANAIAFINVQKGRELYLTYRPLLKQVFDEFAYPAEYRLEDIFMKAVASVIEAPIIKGRISLVRHSVNYKFADKKIEALNDVKKQMLRMGPENTRKIQNKLRQLVEVIVTVNE